jgi:predicted transcriptional regulator
MGGQMGRRSQVSRREHGSLEAEVMSALWAADEPLVPGAVRDSLPGDLAYTTVMTVLVRLTNKGLVRRTKAGRAFAYSPVQEADEHAARQMEQILSEGQDRAAVLTRFVERLHPDEEAVLRQILEQQPPPRKR